MRIRFMWDPESGSNPEFEISFRALLHKFQDLRESSGDLMGVAYSPARAKKILTRLEKLPGWETGCKYAPHPICYREID